MTTTEIPKYDCATIRRQLAAELRVDIDVRIVSEGMLLLSGDALVEQSSRHVWMHWKDDK